MKAFIVTAQLNFKAEDLLRLLFSYGVEKVHCTKHGLCSMGQLIRDINPSGGLDLTYWDIEKRLAAWVDFFWTSIVLKH